MPTSTDRTVQVVLKLPAQLAADLERVAHTNGFTKAGFIAHLFATYRKAVAMGDVERDLLAYLWKWGPRNAHRTPARIDEVADHLRYKVDGVRAAAAELEREGLLLRAPIEPGAGFRNDLAVSLKERLFLSRGGRTAASLLG